MYKSYKTIILRLLSLDMTGIGIQQGFVALFVLIMIRFHVDVRRIGRHQQTSWQPQLYSLYIVMVLITVSIPFQKYCKLARSNNKLTTADSY